MAEGLEPAGNEIPQAGLQAVIEIFTRACAQFNQALSRAEHLLDATDFTSSIHELAFEVGRIRALAEALTCLTGSPEWIRRGEEVLAEYMSMTALPEHEGI